MRQLMEIAEDARRVKHAVAALGTNDKNRGLLAIADALIAHADEIIAANQADIENGRAAGLADGLIDRLMLDEKRLEGIAEGVGQGRFAPEETITREQLVTMLYRYARYQAYDVSASANLNRFADSDAVSGFAANAMRWAVSENIILGKESGRLDPQGAATRAEIAAVFERFVKTVVI